MAYRTVLAQQLSTAQVFGLAGAGALFWAAAAATVRYFGPIIFENQVRRVATYALVIPASYLLILIGEFLVGTSLRQRLISSSIMTTTALILDGVAFMWFPTLYENPQLQKSNSKLAMVFSRMGAGSILYGAGIGLGIALLTH